MNRTIYIGKIPPTPLIKGKSWICTVSRSILSTRPRIDDARMAALSIAQMADPTFSMDRIAFSPEDLLGYLRKSKPGKMYYLEGIPSLTPGWRRLVKERAGDLALSAVRKSGVGLIIASSMISPCCWAKDVRDHRDTEICTLSCDASDAPEPFKGHIGLEWHESIRRSTPEGTKIELRYPVVNDRRITRVFVPWPSEDLQTQYREIREAYIRRNVQAAFGQQMNVD